MPLRGLAVAVVLVLVCGAVGCGKKTKPRHRTENIRVGASISTLAHFIEKVGGKYVKVVLAIPGAQNPYSYAPSDKRMKQLAANGLYFSIGMPFERVLIPRLNRMQKDIKFVDVTKGLVFREYGGLQADSPSGDGDTKTPKADFRGRSTRDPYIWLDPRNAQIIVTNICAALKKADPAHGVEFEQNRAAYIKEIAAADKEIRQILAPLKDREFLVFHPAFGYFADAYNLKQAFMGYKGAAPTTKVIQYWARHTDKKRRKILFVQPQFNARRAQVAAQIFGGIIMPMNPLAEDYIDNLHVMAKEIVAALQAD